MIEGNFFSHFKETNLLCLEVEDVDFFLMVIKEDWGGRWRGEVGPEESMLLVGELRRLEVVELPEL